MGEMGCARRDIGDIFLRIIGQLAVNDRGYYIVRLALRGETCELVFFATTRGMSMRVDSGGRRWLSGVRGNSSYRRGRNTAVFTPTTTMGLRQGGSPSDYAIRNGGFPDAPVAPP